MAGGAEAATIPQLLLHHAAARGARPAIREKGLGIWQSWSWAEVKAEVEALAHGLAGLGLKRGDKLAIIGDNRPQLYWAMVAAQAIGAVPVPLYQDSVAEELQYVLDHAEARFAVVEDQEQVDKLLSIKDRCPRLETIIYSDPRGLRHYDRPFLKRYDAVQAAGRERAKSEPGWFAAEATKGRGEELAIICYTSGTTGRPKGVMISQSNLVEAARAASVFDGLDEHEEVLAYLPMAWVGDNFFSLGQAFVTGFTVNCPESAETVMLDLREIGPTYFFAPPRVFENILTTVSIRMEDAGWIKRKLFQGFMGLARRSGAAILDGKPVSLLDRLLYRLGDVLIYGPLKNTLGFSRLKLAYTAGEAIGPDIFVFYRSLGINLKQLYGQTESTVYLCLHKNGDVKPETVGPPAPGCEVKLTPEGEVIYRGPGVFMGYYKNPVATAETKSADGWVRTGDAGVFDPDGHLKIIDRAKDVGRLNDGTLFAPKYIENKLKFFPAIKEAVAFGDKRDFAACFINIDLAAVGNWAERQGISYTSYTDLAGNPRVRELIKGQIEQVNRDLAADPALAGSQVRRFLILHKELDADDGELTRTRKVRRGPIAERYAELIAALYDGREHVRVEAQVTFEDGRTGRIEADLAIADCAVQPVLKRAA